MDKIYFKYYVYDNGSISIKQNIAKVKGHNESYVIAEYYDKEKEEYITKAFAKGQYQDTPYLVEM